MTLHQMHRSFRAFGQQVGLQQVRGILPETIDLFLNDSISEAVQTELVNSVRTAFQETANTQSSTMSAINSIRTLYKTVRYTIMGDNVDDVADNTTEIVGFYSSKNSFHVINMPTVGSDVNRAAEGEGLIAPMMYLGFSIEFNGTLRGQAVACRMIGSDVLETTLRDFCNGATPESPIVCLKSASLYDNGNEDIKDRANEQLEIYIGAKGLPIKYLNVKYIKVPAMVRWDVDPDLCINCDLPEYMHYGIVENAVAKYQKSITQMQPQQQQAQPNAQQQALARLLGGQG